jgi:hypothetical protein
LVGFFFWLDLIVLEKTWWAGVCQEIATLSTNLESICQSKGQPPGRLPRVTNEGETLKRMFAGVASDLWCVSHDNHGKDPSVDEVLHAIADGVDGVEPGLKAWIDIPLVWPDVHTAF